MIVAPTLENIKKAAALIQAGELVAFPTETVYGLGADATNDEAVKKIFALKGRPAFNPLIIHVASFDEVLKVADVQMSSAMGKNLILLSEFWPGPLSVVLPKGEGISKVATGGKSSVAVRIPRHPVALELIEEARKPIAAPSANISSYVSPTKAQHVEREFEDKLQVILDGGPTDVGLESTVLSLITPVPTILRPGVVTFEELSKVLGKVELLTGLSPTSAISSPGMLEVHYAPITPIAFVGDIKDEDLPEKVGLIRFSDSRDFSNINRYAKTSSLSASGNLEEVAKNLFSAIREYDEEDLDLILIDSCEEKGLGAAIMDRLRKASARFYKNKNSIN